MALFRRRKNTEEPTPAPQTADEEIVTPDAQGTDPGPDAAEAHLASLPAVGTERGPWDRASAPDLDGYLDLGALWLPAVQGMMLTFEIDESTQQVTAVQVMQGESMLQLQAFAAPRSSGIWGEIRRELADGITAQGGRVGEEIGPFGAELLVETGGNRMRFIGVDGPRWFLRGVVNGPSAVQPEGVEIMRQLIEHVVVDRGGEPMGPRELLPLAFPDEGIAAEDEPRPGAYDLDPFERGPEITEIN